MTELFSRQIKDTERRFTRAGGEVVRTFLFKGLQVFSAVPFQR
jgi:hypothetical protein